LAIEFVLLRGNLRELRECAPLEINHQQHDAQSREAERACEKQNALLASCAPSSAALTRCEVTVCSSDWMRAAIASELLLAASSAAC